MPELVEVSDPADPRLVDYLHLTDAELRRKVEAGRGLFIAESVPVIRRALASGHRIRSMLLTAKRYRQLADAVRDRDLVVYVAPQDILNRVVGFDLHRGAVALAERAAEAELFSLVPTTRFLAVLEGINDLENLGAIFRSAAGLGVEGVLLDPTCADPYHRRVVRVSMGTVLQLPFLRVAEWPDVLDVLQHGGFTVVALSPRPDAVEMASVEPPDRVVLMLGAEGPGLSDEALRRADLVVRIPMSGDVDSLNVGHAAAIAFHHFRPVDERP